MTRVVVNEAVRNFLGGYSETVLLCDESGRVLGQFIPVTACSSAAVVDLSQWQPVTADISDKERQRRAKSTEKRYTTAEVLAYLEKR
jgi:hypothetical protein